MQESLLVQKKDPNTLKSRSFWIGFSLYLLASLDELNIQISSFNFKFNSILLLAIGVLITAAGKARVPKNYLAHAVLFIIASTVSGIFSISPEKGILYIPYILSTLIFTVIAATYYSGKNPDTFLKGILYSISFQIIIAAALVALGIHPRAKLFYYEPSYFSLAATPLFVVLANSMLAARIKEACILLCITILYLITSKSANALLLIGLAFTLSFFIQEKAASKRKMAKRTLTSVIALTAAVLISIIIVYSLRSYSGNDLLFSTLSKIASSPDLIPDILSRTGNRPNRIALAYDVFTHNTLLGVGPGAYLDHIKNISSDLFSLPAWVSPQDQPPINIFLEVAATTGIVGLTFFLSTFHQVFRITKTAAQKSKNARIVYISFICMTLALLIENSYLRIYFWILVGLGMSFLAKYKNIKRPDNA